MNEDEIRQQSIDAVEVACTIAKNYVSGVRNQPVYPDQTALTQLTHFSTKLNETGRRAEDILSELHTLGSPATVASTGGRYFGLVVGGSLPSAMGAGIVTSAWDQIALTADSSPVAHHLEQIAAGWILRLLHLPDNAHVGFVTGTTMAHISALSAARQWIAEQNNIDIEECGMASLADIKVVMPEQVHVTVLKALRILGFGQAQYQFVPCDKEGRMDAKLLPKLTSKSIVILQAGNVNSGACDPFNDIIPTAKESGAWVHVDGAFGLWAAASPSKRYLTDGVEMADSWATDGHKWLNTPYDCGFVITRHTHALAQVMTTSASYLTQEKTLNAKDSVPEFSRRARGVEVWAALSELGYQGVADLINRCCSNATLLANGLQKMGFTILNDVTLNQIVATLTPETLQREMLTHIQQSGVCWFGSTTWQGHNAIRISISSWATTTQDIGRTLQTIQKAIDLKKT